MVINRYFGNESIFCACRAVTKLAVAPNDPRHLFVGCESGDALLIDTVSRRALLNFRGHSGVVFDIGVAEQDAILVKDRGANGHQKLLPVFVTCGADATARLWDAVSQTQLQVWCIEPLLVHPGIANVLAFTIYGYFVGL